MATPSLSQPSVQRAETVIHKTAIDFIQRFSGERLTVQTASAAFFDEPTLKSWLDEQYPDLSLSAREAIALFAKPYFDHSDTPVYVIQQKDTLFITGASDASISFIHPSALGNQQQIIFDLPHAGTKAPTCVNGLLSETVIANESVCSTNPFTIWNQADVGVLEVSGSIWQNSKHATCGSAVLTNLIISNGNRAPAQEGQTNHVYNTHSYRRTPLYKDPQQPTAATKRALKKNHDLSIAAAAACRAAACIANPHDLAICLELHSYSGYSHDILDTLFSPTQKGADLTTFAPQNGGAGTQAFLDYLRSTYNSDDYQGFVRPLVSVLDVSDPKKPDKYSTVTQAEMDAFVSPFLQALHQQANHQVLDEANHHSPVVLNDWPQSRPDVYGAANSILHRLDAVLRKADGYLETGAYLRADDSLEAKDNSLIDKTINTVTIEFSRVLVSPDEASNIQSNATDFYKRCQSVGNAFVAGLNQMHPLIQQRMRSKRQ